MELLGKCPPNPTELQTIADYGFEKMEVYLEPHHLDNFEETVDNLRNAPVTVRSVHTPHVTIEDREYIKLADELADEFDASLVVHSSKIVWSCIPLIEELELQSPRGYENSTGYSQAYIERVIFAQGYRLTFDTAHYALACDYSEDAIEDFLTMYGSEIEVVHLCDVADLKDGVPFSEGELDLEQVARAVDENYEGPVVLEVMPEHQHGELNAVLDVLQESRQPATKSD